MDPRIALTDRFYELNHLAKLANSLAVNKVGWKAGEACPIIIGRINDLVNEAKKNINLNPSHPVDFTDNLWEILKISSTTSTLQQAFKIIFDAIKMDNFRVLVRFLFNYYFLDYFGLLF